jgi:hypothetical protein
MGHGGDRAVVAVVGSAAAEVNELRIGYQPSPLQDASVAMFEACAKNSVKIIKVPNSRRLCRK